MGISYSLPYRGQHIPGTDTRWLPASYKAVQMAEIHANATITLVTSWCRGRGEPLFSNRDGNSGTSMSVRTVQIEPVFVRAILPHFFMAKYAYGPSKPKTSPGGYIYKEDASKWPLLTRGWVYQEQGLSPIILHSSQRDLIWSWNVTTVSECS